MLDGPDRDSLFKEGFAVRAIRVVLRRGAILGGALACPKAIKVEGTVEADEAGA